MSMVSRFFSFLPIAACLFHCVAVAAESAAPTPLKTVLVTCVDSQATMYGTFQSHNQKVVSNGRGIFMTHVRTRNEAYTAQEWRLSHSTDGGKTFSTLYESVDATNPPVLETDSRDNLYLIRVDFVDNNAYLYRFLAEKDHKDPAITVIPGGAAGKYAAMLDEPRECLYFFSHNNSFHVIGLDGTVKSSRTLLQGGQNAVLQYPSLSLTPEGVLHAAWTTVKHNEYLYWDIHHMLSPDGGETWKNLDGTALTPPIVADDTGPTLLVSGTDEFESHTWLSNFITKEGKLHFLYLYRGEPAREHYIRYDIASGKRETDVFPEFKGESLSLQGLDGLFSAPEKAGGPLYCVCNRGGNLACLVSLDNGVTWHDHAVSAEKFTLYAVGGCRRTTADGHVIGSFTAMGDDKAVPPVPEKVYFFSIAP